MQNYCEVCAKRVNLGVTITVQFIVTISFFLLKVSDNYWSCTFFFVFTQITFTLDLICSTHTN